MKIDRIANGELISRLSHGEQLRVFLETCPSAVIALDEEGLIQGFGRAAEAMFGYGEHEVVGRDVSMLMAPPHREKHQFYMDRYLATGEKRIMGTTRIENACDRQGRYFPVEISIGEARTSEGLRYFVGFLRDTSSLGGSHYQLNSIVAELAHTSRVSSMGALATVIAHELNQPLTSIANYTESVRDVLIRRGPDPQNDEIIRILDLCSQQAVRSGQLLHRLREFVKGGEAEVERVAVERLADEAIKLALINGYRRNVQIDTDLPDALPDVLVDRLQGEQVLFNLIRNAFEAMHADSSDGHHLRISGRVSDGFVTVSVADNGPGLDPAIRDTLFDNFVTTKGGGMGVGLAICRQIIEASGGRIWADQASPLGGACISFTLPAAANAAETER